MSLRKKTLLISTITILGLLTILYTVLRLVLMDSFSRLEEDSTRRNVTRALNAIGAELASMESISRDWAAWNDTYAYVGGEYETYPEDNLIDETFANLRINTILIRHCSGEIFYQKAFDLTNQQEIPFPASLLSKIAEDRLFECSQDPHQVESGVIVLDEGPMLVAAHPVVTSEYEGPTLGVMVFGRYLNAEEVRRLAEITHLPVRLQIAGEEEITTDQDLQVRALDRTTIAGFGLMRDLKGEPALILRLDLPRTIYAQGRATLIYLLWSLIIAGLVFAAVTLFPLENLLLSRLARLSSNVQHISGSRNRQARLDETGTDELSSLAHEINKMLAALEQSEAALRQRERHNILNAIPDMLFVLSRQGTFVEVKTDWEYFLGVPVSEIAGKNVRDFDLSQESLDSLHDRIEQALVTGAVQTLEKEFVLQDSRHNLVDTQTYEFRIVALNDNEVLIIARDITERKQAEETLCEALTALQESEEQYMLAVQGANDGLWDWDLRNNRIYFSPRWKSILGYETFEIGNTQEEWLSRIDPDDLDQVEVNLSAHLKGLTPHFESEHRIRHKDGSYRWVLTRGLAVRKGKDSSNCWNGAGPGAAYRMAGSMTDITARKQAEEQLLYDAFHDALTGLANRALFMDRLSRAMERKCRYPENLSAMLFLDLDRFKNVNDSLGHMSGDQLLVSLARRIQALLRTTDSMARLGGDEFVILLEDLVEPGDAMRVAKRIREALKSPFNLDEREVVVTGSIGIVASLANYEKPDDVLRDADIAMYRAKALGKDRYVIFDASLRTRAIALLELENELRGALERGELLLHYQPIFSLANQHITGFEALLRWKSPARDYISPVEFIPVAEETGLIVPIGEWVLRESCRQLCSWQEQYPMDPPLTMSINLSGVQFAQPHLFETIQAILGETGLTPDRLKLEITESVFMANVEHANATLLKLRDLGVQLEIDDFGTGYSSLAYLQHFPIHAIKIDRSFISRICNNGNASGNGTEIVKTIVALARDLGMEAVAEGVETAEQLAQLRELECHYGQGFLFARPMDAAAAGALLNQVLVG